jgi:glycosyltransferase involved in cell wall biosynthesis
MRTLIPRRVALLIPSLEVGGAEKVMIALANYFILDFCFVDLVLQQGGPLAEGLDAGVNLHFLPVKNYRTYTRHLARYYDESRPDFVVTSIYVTGVCAIAARVLSKHKPKIVLGAHNLFTAKTARPDNIKDKYFLSWVARILFPYSDAVVCVSHGVALDILRHISLPLDKLHVIYNPVVPSNIAELTGEPVAHPWLQAERSLPTIVALGRLVPQKGVDTLLRAIQLGPVDARLIIVGDGPERKSLERLALELGIDNRVDFVGIALNPFKYLARADLFVMSSRWEGFGNTLVEALACGCPVIATNCDSGPSEILDGGRYGTLVPVDAVDRLATAMVDTLSQDKKELTRESRIARSLVFSLESAGARYKELLCTLDPWPQVVLPGARLEMRSETSKPTVAFVTPGLQAQPRGGREMLTKLNYDALRALYGDNLVLVTLLRSTMRGWRAIRSTALGHIDGIAPETLQSVLSTLRNANVSAVLLDGSNLGVLASAIRRDLPHVRVTTFFHNVEARFFLGSLRNRKSLKALAILLANYIAERKAVRDSFQRICLSERDSLLLGRIYGAGATHIAPIALEDRYSPPMEHLNVNAENFAIFVGGAFYANLAGIKWYAKNVAPYAKIRVLVVGRGFEDWKKTLEIPGKLEFLGPVDDLGHWYARAQFVVAPIFDGSGMKTKVAEALMHGKKIVGTPEAFSGYEDVLSRVGWVCSTKAEFLRAIDDARRTIVHTFDAELREIYRLNYSFDTARARLSEIMGN